jgi:3-hydroxyisobutyrate dehydrogenase
MSECVGFVGLGNMGLPMAKRLVNVGRDVHVYDLRPPILEDARQAGATIAGGLADLRECETVCIMVWNDQQLVDLMLGPGGLLEVSRAQQTFVIHSTVSPATVLSVGEAALRHGMSVIDAPVSGGAAGNAGTGKLTVMVGGATEDVERCRPVLEDLASTIFHVGPLGAGAAAKLANNTMSIGNLLFVSEALRYGTLHNVDPATMIEIASASSGRSYAAETYVNVLELLRQQGELGNEMRYEPFWKDLFLAVQSAAGEGLHLPLTALAASLAPDLMRQAESALAPGLLTNG